MRAPFLCSAHSLADVLLGQLLNPTCCCSGVTSCSTCRLRWPRGRARAARNELVQPVLACAVVSAVTCFCFLFLLLSTLEMHQSTPCTLALNCPFIIPTPASASALSLKARKPACAPRHAEHLLPAAHVRLVRLRVTRLGPRRHPGRYRGPRKARRQRRPHSNVSQGPQAPDIPVRAWLTCAQMQLSPEHTAASVIPLFSGMWRIATRSPGVRVVADPPRRCCRGEQHQDSQHGRPPNQQAVCAVCRRAAR